MRAPEPKLPVVDGKPVQGMYLGLSELDYDRIPAHRSTILRRLLADTPHHARHQSLYGARSTKKKEQGQLLHMALLEPERFKAQHLVMPSAEVLTAGAFTEFRTNIAKKKKREWLAAHPLPDGITEYLDGETWASIDAMARAVWGNRRAAQMLKAKGGQREVTLVWFDSVGIWCKARLDLLFPWERWVAVADLKSTFCAAPLRFGRQIATLGYDYQGAFYLRGLAHVRGEQSRAKPVHRPFFFIAVENVDPHPKKVGIYELGKVELDMARDEVQRGLETLAACEKTGEWPGYDEEIQKVVLPSWKYRDQMDEMDELEREIAALEEPD